MDTIVSLHSVDFAYANGKNIFSSLDFSLNQEDKIGLAAPNGSRKTTLLHLLVGVLEPRQGELRFNAKPVRTKKDLWQLRCNVGLVMQNSDDQLFCPTVLDDVAFGPLNMGLSAKDAKDVAISTLESLGIGHLAERFSGKLSGGEKKLVALASVLSMKPKALLMDEPTIFLDDGAVAALKKILFRLKTPWLIVSHDKGFLNETCRTILTINRHGKLEKA